MGGKAHGGRRITRDEALALFNDINGYIGNVYSQLAGSFRREKETCGDLDIVIIPANGNTQLDAFCKEHFGMQKNGKKVKRTGLYEGVQVEFYLATPENWGTQIQMWTGSHHFNIRLRRKAKKMGYSMSQYGFKNLETGELTTCRTEMDVFNFLGMDMVMPADR